MVSPGYENPLIKLQSIYDRIQIASSLHLLMPEIACFIEIILTNFLFHKLLDAQKKLMFADLSPLLTIKKAVHQELKMTIKLLEKYSHIHIISRCLEECKLVEKTTPIMSWERACRQYQIIMNLCIFIKHNKKTPYLENSNDTSSLLNLLIVEDKGVITEYKFAPSFNKFDKEFLILDRKKRTAAWYSLHKLSQAFAIYDIKNAENTYSHLITSNQHSAAAIFKSDFHQFDLVLNNNADSKKTVFTVEELKMHAHRIWSIIKPILLPNNPEIFYYAYSDQNDIRKGALIKGNDRIELVGNSAELLHLLVNSLQVTVDDACEELQLSADSIRSARRTINLNLKKRFKITDYISSKGIISLNYLTQFK